MDTTDRFDWPTAARMAQLRAQAVQAAPAPVPRGPEGADPALAGRRVLVVGLGDSGLAMARWCALQGAAGITVADTRASPPRLDELRAALPQARFVAGPLDAAAADALLDGVDLVAWSPGLSPVAGDTAALHWACGMRNVPVEGELTLFARALAHLRQARGYAPKVAAITGTNGKTTTTRLLGHLCAAAGWRAAVCGNVAPAALDALRCALEADALGEPMPQAWVIELSSFQLALADGFAPDAATILNISQDHLDWHGTLDSYVAAKQRIYAEPAFCVHNRADRATLPPRDRRGASFGTDEPTEPGGFGLVHDGGLRWLAEAVVDETALVGRRRKGAPLPVRVRRLMPADALRIRGGHNHENALAALALARAIGLPMAPLLHALRDYAGEPHRCESVAVIDDVEWIDDSKGTNVGATVAALDGLGKRCVLIAGGDGKGQDFSPLAEPVRRHAKAVLLIGRDAPALRAALQGTPVPLEDCATLEAAVTRAAALADTGDAVLLSPACASLDMFRNYAHRAEVFRAAVTELAQEAGQPC